MFHCKTLIVDRQLVSVGSTNFDNRSFRLNDEANLNIYDAAFAERADRACSNRTCGAPAASPSRCLEEPSLARKDA